MATLTKGQLRTVTRTLLRDQEKQAWHDPVLDIIIGQSMDSLASNLIDFAPQYFSNRTTLAGASFNAAGYFDLANLSTRFYRAQSLVRDGQEFFPISTSSVTIDPLLGAGANGVITSPMFGYYIRNNLLWMFPIDLTKNSTLSYSFLPSDYISLADTANIDWPQGFEMLIAHDAALQIVDDEFRSNKFQMLRNEKLDALYSKIKRQYTGPAVQNTIDDQLSWSGI